MRCKLLAGVLFAAPLLFSQSACAAAFCYISEFAAIGQPLSATAQIALEPSVADQKTADFSGGAVATNAFNAATSLVRVFCDTSGFLLFGTSPSAAVTNMPIAAAAPEYFAVPAGLSYKMSVHP